MMDERLVLLMILFVIDLVKQFLFVETRLLAQHNRKLLPSFPPFFGSSCRYYRENTRIAHRPLCLQKRMSLFAL